MTTNLRDGDGPDKNEFKIWDQKRVGGAFELRNATLRNYKMTLQLTEGQREVLIGTLLGDASFSQRDNLPHYSVKFEQSELHEQYVHHLFDIFYPFVGTGPRRRGKRTTNQSAWFRTIQHDSLIFYWDMFYVCTNGNGKMEKCKIVPKNIHKFLTPKALAYWFMDDGTFDLSSGSKSYVFSTQGYKKDECEILRKALKKNFNIERTLQQDSPGWKLYVLRKYSPQFRELVRPHILDCFKHKL